MGYSIGELAKLLGMTREGVRFMEQQGIIHGTRHESNGYREFDYDQFVRLKRVKGYRSLGFSLEEAREMIDDVTRGQLAGRYEEKLAELTQKRKELDEIEHLLLEERWACDYITGRAKDYELVESPELLFYISMRNRERLTHQDLGKQQEDYVKQWTQGMPQTKMFAYYDADGIERKGQIATRDIFEKLALPFSDSLKRFPPMRSIHGALDAPVFEKPDFSSILSFAQDRNLRLTGEFLCILRLTYRGEDGKTWCVHEFFSPVQ